MQVINVVDPLYQSDVRLLVGGVMEDVHQYVVKTHGGEVSTHNKDNATDDGWEDCTDGAQFHVNGDTEVFYIWIQRPELDLLHHEIYHLTHDILHVRGIEYSDNCEDAFSYFSTALFIDAYKKLFAQKKQNRKAR